VKTYILLFRGINVGGRNLLPMKELVRLLQQNKYQNIQTYIQSGNVVLRSHKRPDASIGSIVEKKFGFKPEVLVLEESELTLSIENNPYRSAEGKKIHFCFCKHTPKPDVEKLQRYRSQSEKYYLKGKVFYLYAPDGVGRSKLAANIESCLGVATTARNLNTVNKLQEMMQNV